MEMFSRRWICRFQRSRGSNKRELVRHFIRHLAWLLCLCIALTSCLKKKPDSDAGGGAGDGPQPKPGFFSSKQYAPQYGWDGQASSGNIDAPLDVTFTRTTELLRSMK